MITILENIKESVIREMTRLANQYGAINLAQGITEIEPPDKLLKYAVEAIEGGFNGYTITWGKRELRAKVSREIYDETGVEFDPETEVLITVGASEGIASSIFSQIEGEAGVVIPEPFYENYVPVTLLARGKPIFIKLKRNNYTFIQNDLDNLPKFSIFILNSPHNPTGKVFDEKEVKKVAETVISRDAILLVDETYKHLTYEKDYFSPLKIPQMVDRTILVGSYSKIFSVTGWRVGYVVARKPIMDEIRKVHDYLTVCAPAPFQWAIEQFRMEEEYIEKIRKEYLERRDFFAKILKSAGFEFFVPEGSYYILASFEKIWDGNDWAFAQYLVKNKKIAVVPGSSFYNDKKAGEKLVRFNFARSKTVLKTVGNRLLSGIT